MRATTLSDARCRGAAEVLLRHLWNGTKLASLPLDVRPATREDGYAIQAQWERTSGARLFGWKIAATSVAGQRHINVDGPLAGRLLADMLLEDAATVPLDGNLMRVAEIELAFRLRVDLPPRREPYGVDEVVAAVATLHPAIEVPDSRFADFCAVGAPQLIADNACTNRFLLGPATMVAWRALDLAAHRVGAEVVGKSRHEGSGANVLGDPRIALAWIANELSALGLGLMQGHVVTTGTCVKPIDVVAGDEVRASYGGLGELSLKFA